MDSIKNLPMKILRGLLWRFVRLNRLIVLNAPPDCAKSTVQIGFDFFRANKTASASIQEQIEVAMQAMGEPPGLVASRLAHGDEFFSWLDGAQIVSFGWVTYRDRFLGKVRCNDMFGRVFLYNFHTSKDYRGRGLYPALLILMRQVLGREAANDIIIDVNSSNISSIKGIDKAGFIPLAQLVSLVFFNRWQWLIKQNIINSKYKNFFEI